MIKCQLCQMLRQTAVHSHNKAQKFCLWCAHHRKITCNLVLHFHKVVGHKGEIKRERAKLKQQRQRFPDFLVSSNGNDGQTLHYFRKCNQWHLFIRPSGKCPRISNVMPLVCDAGFPTKMSRYDITVFTGWVVLLMTSKLTFICKVKPVECLSRNYVLVSLDNTQTSVSTVQCV